jgi:hypothetical protein
MVVSFIDTINKGRRSAAKHRKMLEQDFRQMMFVSFNSNTTGVTSGAEAANPSGAPEYFWSNFHWI